MPDDLSMRRTVIGGETAPDDYIVTWDRLSIGRIFKTTAVGGNDAWSWSCALPNVPQPSTHRGRAGSLDAAKAAFRAAWTDLESQLSYDQIKEARAIGGDRSRPWHKRG
ncbi:hypothetical protein J4G43_030100 [Bradyrhizobium barranii subsp. barranii]|uniref:Uncharacterized protein n=1 Tax=Bradyrhizobium barranii subsp. barranii TaxID=2823807 RepID=A0A939MCN0_9BRAD|nr:hypothetical protein [Bradyrhizobium barranii]UEM08993.1 hypothetical protein J4G43_030100 [Bradyrhizobium barranii subsp. barranii]